MENSVIYVMGIEDGFQVVAMNMKTGELAELSQVFQAYLSAHYRAQDISRVLGVTYREDMNDERSW